MVRARYGTGVFMKLNKRNCDVEMTLDECEICGQCGVLKIEGEKIHFATTDGCGQFFGQLMHLMTCLMGLEKVNRNNHIGLTYKSNTHPTKAEGEVKWGYLGHDVTWKLSRIFDGTPLYEDFVCTLKVEARNKNYSFKLSFKELCYAVAKCGTEVLKRFGIMGYTRFAEQFEDFNLREFLEIKAFALDLVLEMGEISMFYSGKKTTSLNDEIELLLFDM